MLPEDDRVIETCRSVLNVLMYILDLLNNIYIYIYIYAFVGVLINYRMHGATIKILRERIHERTNQGNILRSLDRASS